mgnify:CR=1 FL=1
MLYRLVSLLFYQSLFLQLSFLEKLIKEKFDLTPNGIIKYLELEKPIYSKTTNYGHFGKNELKWEEIIEI